MLDEEKLKHQFPRLDNFIGCGPDDHPLGNRRRAGWDLTSFHLLDFHKAHAASTKGMKLFIVAEYGYSYACRLGCIKNGSVFRH
jgi:hypothetical protein